MRHFKRLACAIATAFVATIMAPALAVAQVTPSAFQASTPGWVAMSHISLNDTLDQPSDAVPDFNADRPVVEVWDVSHPNGLDAPAVWPLQGFSPKAGSQYLWSASHLGQVFGLAIDHNPDGPYIYAAETAIYGSWYNTDPANAGWTNNLILDCNQGAPYAGTSMGNPNCYPGGSNLSSVNNSAQPFTQPPLPGLFAFPATLPVTDNNVPPPNSHGGAIWRLSLKADLSATYDPNRTYELVARIPTDRMSLGQIAYNPDANTFYVSNFADGLIYIFNNPPVGGAPVTSGFITYDHGTTQGIPPEPHFQFTPYGRRVWGLQYNAADHKLYYAVWNADHRYRRMDGNGNAIHNQIWSVDLDTAGHPVAGTTVKQFDIPYYPLPIPTGQPLCYELNLNPVCLSYSQPVSDIAFNKAGDVMLLAERGEHIGLMIGAGYDKSTSGNNILAHNSRILRYRRDPATGQWVFDTLDSSGQSNDYGLYSGDNTFNHPYTPTLANGWHTDSTGGVDFGFGYTTDANDNNTVLDVGARDKWVWNGTNSGGTLNSDGSCYQGILPTTTCPLVYGAMGAELPGTGAQAPVPNGGNGIALYPQTNLYFVDFDGHPESITKSAMGDVEVNRFLGGGTLKLCKVAGPGVAQGTAFSFTVNGQGPVDVPAGPAPGGWCKPAGSFEFGSTVTINESASAGIAATDIRVEPASALSGQPDLANGTVNLQIGAGVTEVTFVNARPAGYLELCKTADAPGLFSFDVDGAGTVTVPSDACSAALQVPAGQVTIRELTPGYALTACSTQPVNRLVSCDQAGRMATVTVAAGGIASQTIVNLVNTATKPTGPTGDGTLKICKVAGDGLKAGGTYWFMGKTVSVTSGPAPGGLCRIAGTYPAGTALTVDEWPHDGIVVTGIDVQPASAVTTAADLGAGKVGVTLGTGVTEVTFTNARPSAYVEICKAANVPGNFDFKVESYGVVTVPSGSCSPALKVTAGLVKINETMPAGYSMTACVTVPVGRLDTCDLAGHSLVGNVPAGGIPDQTIVNITNYKCIDTPKHPCLHLTDPGGPRMVPVTGTPTPGPAPAATAPAKRP